MVWYHPDQSRISIQAGYKMLEGNEMSGGSLMVLAHTYNDVKHSLHPFPHAIAVAIANDTEWDMNMMTLSDLTAWPPLSDKD